MLRYGVTALAANVVALLLAVLPSSPGALGEEPQQTAAIRIGVVSSFFRDLPEPAAQAVLRPMKSLIETQTGLRGDVAPSGNALKLGRHLVDDKVQLGVFNGFEFAWARQKYPKLLPLVIAVNKRRQLHSYLVVRSECHCNALTSFKGKTLALPKFTREFSRLFLERACQEKGHAFDQFFAKVITPPDIEDALDAVVEGTADVTVVDSSALENFQQRKPGRFAKLKILQESEPFPAAVVAYYPGGMDRNQLQSFHDGMIHASDTPRGQRMLSMCRMTAFEEVPADYDQCLTAIAKAYPAPKDGSN